MTPLGRRSPASARVRLERRAGRQPTATRDPSTSRRCCRAERGRAGAADAPTCGSRRGDRGRARTSARRRRPREPLHRTRARVRAGRAPRAGEVLLTPALAERLERRERGRRRARSPTARPVTGDAASLASRSACPASRWSPPRLDLAGGSRRPRLHAAPAAGVRTYLVDLPAGTDADALWRPLAEHGRRADHARRYADPERYPGGGGVGGPCRSTRCAPPRSSR